ncbi:MAG TPA: ABC transporter permease [Thermoanaerobaculia bacterium]|nr:ABC transporter permease [Thermoanaerobaculia bacterium]
MTTRSLPFFVMHDLRYALRSFRRRPLVPLLAAGVLALGIGANVAVFTVIARTLLRPLPYADAGRLLVLFSTFVAPDRGEETFPSGSVEIVQWRVRATQFSAIEAVRPLWMTARGSGDPESISGALVTGGFFRLFGVRPVMGRDFAPEEDVPDARVGIITYGLWRRRFGGDPKTIGRSLLIDGRPVAIIGVLPRAFELVNVTPQPEIFIPAGLGPANMPQPGSRGYTVLGRLRSGVSPGQAETDLRRISAQLAVEYPATHQHWTASVKPLHDAAFGERRHALVVLWLMVALVHLLACVNVGGLFSVRVADQRGVTALRLALGASRAGILRHRLIESGIVTAAGAVAGLVAGWAIVRWVLTRGALGELAAPAGNAWILPLFLVALSLLTAAAVAIVPALRETQTSLVSAISEQGTRSTSSVWSTRLRELFIAGQVALAVPLLLAASATIDHFRELQGVSLGFEPRRVLASQIVMPPRYDRPKRTAFARELIRRLEATPGVESAAVTQCNFAPGQAVTTTVSPEGSTEPISMNYRRVTPRYFETMGIPLLAGRAFTDDDTLDAPQVMIVSRSLARRFFGDADPIGKKIIRAAPNPPAIVIGVAPDVRDDGANGGEPLTLYSSYLQGNNVYLTLVVRTQGDPRLMREPIRRAVWSLDPDITPSKEAALADLMSDALGGDRLQMLLLSGFGFVALVLASLGIYGMTSYAVVQRMREIGVRLAFGATPGAVILEIVRRAVRSVSLGLLLGVALALVAQRAASLVAYDMARFDARSAALVIGTLFVSALIAATVPSVRTRSVSPASLLRDSGP